VFRSLLVQVLWAPLVSVLVGGVLLGIEGRGRGRMAERVRAVAALRQQLDRVLLRLSDRHTRTMARTREALLEPRLQVAILAWSSDHYLREMERHLSDAHDTVRGVSIPNSHPRLATDMAHLDRQLERIAEKAGEVAPVLDALLLAVSEPEEVEGEQDTAAEVADPEQPREVATQSLSPLASAQQSLHRADRAMHSALRVAQRMAHRAATLQTEHAASSITAVPRAVWWTYLGWIPTSLALALWPLLRLRRFSANPEANRARSTEERRLVECLADLRQARGRLEADLGDRTRDAERCTNASRRAEQELALLRLYNENLVNSLRSAIVVTDTAGVVTTYNRAARKVLGLTPEQLGRDVSDQPLYAALLGRTRDARAELDRAMTDHEPLRFDSLSYAAPDGEILIDLTVAPYLDESGAARGLLWVSDDVTDAIRVKKQLLAAERLAAVGRLSAQVAHEVRNPLSAIGLNAELLEEELVSRVAEARRDEAASLLRAIGSEVERLTQITEGYLELTRLPRPELREVDLNHVVGDLFSMLNEELKAYRVTVELELATPAPRAWADPGQLRQALLNIVRNSREAMPDGGTLRVRTSCDGDFSIIEVCDTGPGIPSDVVPRVFEPFYTTKRDGTGLGLSLTQQIASEHGGGVMVTSRPPDGTTILLTLPALASDALPVTENMQAQQ
jgi:PAS domain S-box-containing protein